MPSREELNYLLKKYSFSPHKSLGQNFCLDDEVLEQMVAMAKISPTENVLEIGPGFGFLTNKLLFQAKRVVAIEKDPILAAALKNLVKVTDNLEVVKADVLCLSEQFFSNLGKYSVVANLPYSITNHFFRKFLSLANRPRQITVLVQLEVAERLTAKRGDLSLLGLLGQLYAQPKLLAEVSPSSFWPEPKVTSAILQLTKITGWPKNSAVVEKVFWQVAKCGFAAKRKQIHNNLQAGLKLTNEEIGKLLVVSEVSPNLRAQDLEIGQWLKLAENFSKQKFK